MGLGRQWEERLRIWDSAFAPNLYRKVENVEVEGFTTMEHLSLADARGRGFRAFPVGTAWGRMWEYGWFCCSVALPPEAEGEKVVLRLGVAPEMLVYVNGEEAGSIDRQHEYILLSSCAVSGSRYEIYAEGYAGHGPRLENGGIYPEDVAPAPEPPRFQCVIGESSLCVWNERMFQAYVDYHTLYELWKALPEKSLRWMQLAEGLKEFTYRADFELREPLRTESVWRAREVLRPLLQAHNGSSAPAFTVFGQSHLDLAWLWTWEETKRKAARTYANQLALMEQYPEYRFLLCEPPLLENLKANYPRLYGRVKEKVREGRFIPEGAVWVEGDTNMAGGESLIRQFVLGKNWFMEEFGIDSQMAWMPDTFGFTGALPQIMKGCRVPYFATQKLLRCDPECEQFPYNLFWWEGIDGSKVLAHIYKKNNAVFSPAGMVQRWEADRNQQEKLDGMLFPFGYGDGGGGPTRLMVEMLGRCGDLEGAPRTRMESPVEYFRRAAEKPVDNVYYGELYLPWHRGSYTAQARIKRKVRRAEGALREAEFLAGILRLHGRLGKERPALIDRLWKELLFCEFHDILPGTSIRRVNEEAEAALADVEREALGLAEILLEELAGKGAVFNSLSWERGCGGIRIPSCGYAYISQEDMSLGMHMGGMLEGADVQSAGTQSGSLLEGVDLWAGDLPEGTDMQVGFMPDGNGLPGAAMCGKDGGTDEGTGKIVTVESACYRARVDCLGRIVSLRSKGSGYEYAGKPLNELCMYRDVNVDYDAWELGRMYEQVPVPLGRDGRMEIRREKDGIHVDVYRGEARFTWRQEIVFLPDSPRIEFRTRVDWRERHKLLKVAFPTAVYTKEAVEEIQFGYLKRPTHKSRQYERDLYETCHHRYAALSDGKNGLAVLNDCKYGISAQDGTLALTLLRAPVIPDMEADMGEQVFRYAIYLFDGPFTESNVVREAYEFNIPVTLSGGTAGRGMGEQAVSYFGVDRANVIVETCKPAMDVEDGVVVRLYECMGSAVRCRLSLPSEVKRVWVCNMLEEKQGEAAVDGGAVELEFRAFEIKTVLLGV